MNKFLQVLLFFSDGFDFRASVGVVRSIFGRKTGYSDHNFVTASKFQTQSVSADPANSKLLEGLMISFVAQGSVDEAISIAEVYKPTGM